MSGGGPGGGSRLNAGYAIATRVFSVVAIAVGIAIIGVTLAQGGGPLATGLLMGLLFVALGAGRLYLALRRG